MRGLTTTLVAIPATHTTAERSRHVLTTSFDRKVPIMEIHDYPHGLSEEDYYALEQRILAEHCYLAGQGAGEQVCSRQPFLKHLAGALSGPPLRKGRKVINYCKQQVNCLVCKYPEGIYFRGIRQSPMALRMAVTLDLDLDETGQDAPIRRLKVTQILGLYRCSPETFRHRGRDEKRGPEADLLRLLVSHMIEDADRNVIAQLLALLEKYRPFDRAA